MSLELGAGVWEHTEQHSAGAQGGTGNLMGGCLLCLQDAELHPAETHGGTLLRCYQ